MACTGVQARFQQPWTPEQLDMAYRRGAHPSATKHFPDFLLTDIFNYVQVGYWTVLPYSAVRSYKSLRLAPAGVVPQRERRPRPIMDYTYYGTNQHCYPDAPHHAMQ
jgi:hypothetical protein